MNQEEIVTKLLSSKEIIRVKENKLFATSPMYNLGEFLNKIKSQPSPYGNKYVFIK